MRAITRLAVRPVLGPKMPIRWQRNLADALNRFPLLPRGTRLVTVDLGNRPAERIDGSDTDNNRAVLYLHGGGYTVGSPTTHRALAAHLAAAVGVPVYVLDYRLAPEHPYPAAVDDAAAAYRALLDTGIDPQRLTVAGDSAGGGLALALMLRLRETGMPMPAALALISPWVDLTLDHVRDSRRDPLLRASWLRACAARYSGERTDVRTPEISPLYADLTGLPPMLVHSADDEILLPDIEHLVDQAETAGVPVVYRRLERMWHVAHMHAGLVTASTAAVREIGAFLRNAFDHDSRMGNPNVN
ncbi:alpha/beta hydrolase fold domain-containing protein [Streptomyces sp. NPDC001536]|uniref:alpha/beta hydrolase fold domain-containing protein n=1 Tax=Streptomyces sp. NPDC001536 TaxID=3364583 RepID=UPI0036C078B4